MDPTAQTEVENHSLTVAMSSVVVYVLEDVDPGIFIVGNFLIEKNDKFQAMREKRTNSHRRFERQ